MILEAEDGQIQGLLIRWADPKEESHMTLLAVADLQKKSNNQC